MLLTVCYDSDHGCISTIYILWFLWSIHACSLCDMLVFAILTSILAANLNETVM